MPLPPFFVFFTLRNILRNILRNKRKKGAPLFSGQNWLFMRHFWTDSPCSVVVVGQTESHTLKVLPTIMEEPMQQTNRRTYTVEEAWRRAGIGRHSFYAALHRGDIPGALRVGRLWLVSRAPFDAWLNGGGYAKTATIEDLRRTLNEAFDKAIEGS